MKRWLGLFATLAVATCMTLIIAHRIAFLYDQATRVKYLHDKRGPVKQEIKPVSELFPDR
jgi:hypothetical protein